MKTTSLLLDEQLRLETGWRDLPDPGVGEALVRVEYAGVCGSDLHVLTSGAWVSYWPATLGHEVAGVVEACPGGELPLGTPVVIDSRVPCGRCAGCRQAANLCEQLAWVGEAFPGGFAGHLVIAAGSLVRRPEELEGAIAVLAEPLAVAMHALARSAAVLGEEPAGALIVGYGPIGALVHAAIARRCAGIEVAVREPLAERRRLASAFGARIEETDAPPGQHRLVIEAAGSASAVRTALRSTARGGCLVLVALGHQPVEWLPAELVESSVSVLGCSGFDGELPLAVAELAADPERYRPLVTEAVLIGEAAARLSSLAARPAAGKLLVCP